MNFYPLTFIIIQNPLNKIYHITTFYNFKPDLKLYYFIVLNCAKTSNHRHSLKTIKQYSVKSYFKLLQKLYYKKFCLGSPSTNTTAKNKLGHIIKMNYIKNYYTSKYLENVIKS